MVVGEESDGRVVGEESDGRAPQRVPCATAQTFHGSSLAGFSVLT